MILDRVLGQKQASGQISRVAAGRQEVHQLTLTGTQAEAPYEHLQPVQRRGLFEGHRDRGMAGGVSAAEAGGAQSHPRAFRKMHPGVRLVGIDPLLSGKELAVRRCRH
jgi:hypothetical protein